ncbi:MAG: hypothetical protein KGL39_47650 [Patescibacteria group bacterium]|nr:hypothetical protein [Patescibacteria group bacterium]
MMRSKLVDGSVKTVLERAEQTAIRDTAAVLDMHMRLNPLGEPGSEAFRLVGLDGDVSDARALALDVLRRINTGS